MNREHYIAMLAGRGMKIGDQVVCDYRVPTSHQYWTAPFWVGVIEDVSEDPAEWNGHNSEAHFCALLKVIKVRYLDADGMDGHVQHDSLGSMRRLEFGNVDKSPWFADGTTIAEGYKSGNLFRFAIKCGLTHLYSEHRRAAFEMAA